MPDKMHSCGEEKTQKSETKTNNVLFQVLFHQISPDLLFDSLNLRTNGLLFFIFNEADVLKTLTHPTILLQLEHYHRRPTYLHSQKKTSTRDLLLLLYTDKLLAPS